MSPVIRIISVVILWGFCIYRYYADFDKDYWFKEEIQILLIVLSGLISLSFLYIEYKIYRLANDFSFSSAIGTIFSVLTLLFVTHKLKQQDNTATKLSIINSGFLSKTIEIDLRENGTYKYTQSAFMGSSFTIRGKYELRDSLIVFNDSKLFSFINSKQLVMKTVPKNNVTRKQSLVSVLLFGKRSPSYQDTLNETLVFKANISGLPVDSTNVFRLIKNNKK